MSAGHDDESDSTAVSKRITASDLIPYFGSGLMVLIALVMIIVKPLSNSIDDVAQLMLGGLLITLSVWIFKPFSLPYSAGGFFLGAFALAIGIKPAVVFAGFTQSAIWTLVPALFFGYTLQKTGLGKRIALAIIRLFKPSYLTLVVAWAIIGVILSILTPSITVRVAIIMPIAVQCTKLCQLQEGSKGNSLILLTAFGMALIPGSGWLTGALWGPIISGMVNAVPETQGLVTFDSWLGVLFVPTMLVTALLICGSLLLLKPKEGLSADAIDSIKNEPQAKLSKGEKTAGLILVAVFVMFVTSSLHGIPDAALCLAAVFALFLFRVLDTSDLSVGANWDLVIFIAMALSLNAIFTETGISAWLAGIIVPALAPIANNPFIFVIAAVTIMFLWRFVDVAFFIPTMAIMVPILPAIYDAYQINPLVWLAVFVMAANSFLMNYQNAWAMMSVSIAGESAWKNQHLALYGAVYIAACLVSLAVMVPIWINAGFFG
ncbi:MAG: SLC13 family permease [Coriobacteriia bacterium]|nr:SLC13 family permease [Coriobacteriia bacterium]MCL2137126.1 SLC13 family permease [Coriobacteriia bacterium]